MSSCHAPVVVIKETDSPGTRDQNTDIKVPKTLDNKNCCTVALPLDTWLHSHM